MNEQNFSFHIFQIIRYLALGRSVRAPVITNELLRRRYQANETHYNRWYYLDL